MDNFGVGITREQGKHNMSLGHLIVPENKEELKEEKNGGMQKGHSC